MKFAEYNSRKLVAEICDVLVDHNIDPYTYFDIWSRYPSLSTEQILEASWGDFNPWNYGKRSGNRLNPLNWGAKGADRRAIHAHNSTVDSQTSALDAARTAYGTETPDYIQHAKPADRLVYGDEMKKAANLRDRQSADSRVKKAFGGTLPGQPASTPAASTGVPSAAPANTGQGTGAGQSGSESHAIFDTFGKQLQSTSQALQSTLANLQKALAQMGSQQNAPANPQFGSAAFAS